MSQPLTKPAYEVAVDDFVQADTNYKTFQESVLNGELAVQLAGGAKTADELRYRWVEAMSHLQELLEERNAKASAAAALMRAAVQLSPTQWRGAEGKPSRLAYGPLEANSKTSRSFNPETLIEKARSKGILERLMQVTTPNKDGREEPIVKQTWAVNYQATLRWLTENKHTDIAIAAYEESESTPAVSGAKPLTFLGEAK